MAGSEEQKKKTNSKESKLREEIEKEIREQLEVEQKDARYLDILLEHISNVQKACLTIGRKLLNSESEEDKIIGMQLIANAQIHDNSKFHGIEWKYLRTPDLIVDTTLTPEEIKVLFKAAHEQHVTTNKHHIEYWGDFKRMPPEFVAEMVCDFKSRSQEFGTDLRQWVKKDFPKRYNISTNCKNYRLALKYVNLLLEEPFKKIN